MHSEFLPLTCWTVLPSTDQIKVVRTRHFKGHSDLPSPWIRLHLGINHHESIISSIRDRPLDTRGGGLFPPLFLNLFSRCAEQICLTIMLKKICPQKKKNVMFCFGNEKPKFAEKEPSPPLGIQWCAPYTDWGL